MPTITISKKELLKSLGKKISDDELKERISMLGTDLEGIDGDEITVEIFPNRPDLLSQQGFARALASFMGIRTGLQEFPIKKGSVVVHVEKSVEKCRPYTACAVVRNLLFDDEKIREVVMIQEKLHITFCRNRKKVAIGIYPMEHITPPIYLRGLAPEKIVFRPLEARGKMDARDILENHPKGKDYAHLMEGLDTYGCFIDDAGEVMSLTPIINSHHTGKVDENTKDVFVECSGFDFKTVSECLNMIVTALADMGGTIEGCTLKYAHGKLGTITTPNLAPRKMQVDREYVNKVLGLNLNEKQLGEMLEKMGFGYEKGTVLIPAYRTDILHQVDFVEDVAIAYGYENFTPTIPNVATVGEESWMSKIKRKTRDVLVGHGLLEMKNYHLVAGEFHKQFKMQDLVTLKNSVSKEFDTMRHDPLITLLAALGRNQHHEYPQHVFEIGTGFRIEKGSVTEEEYAAVLLAGENEDYTSARQILDSIAHAFGLELAFSAHENEWLLEGRGAIAHLNKTPVAIVGEVHPRILSALGLEVPCACVLFNLSAANK